MDNSQKGFFFSKPPIEDCVPNFKSNGSSLFLDPSVLYLDSLFQGDSGSGFVQLYFALCFLFTYPSNGYFDYSSHQTKNVYLLSFGDIERNVSSLTASQNIYSHYIMRRESPQGQLS